MEALINESILPKIQDRSYEIWWIDSFLETTSLDSALYASYLLKPSRISLFDTDKPTELGTALLHDFEEAVELYSQVPELRAYLDQDDLDNVENEDAEDLNEQLFTHWLEENHTITNGSNVTLHYVGERAPRPYSGLRPSFVGSATLANAA